MNFDWVGQLQGLPIVISMLVVFVFALIASIYLVGRVLSRGFEFAVKAQEGIINRQGEMIRAQEKRIDALEQTVYEQKDEVKKAKDEGTASRAKLEAKIDHLEKEQKGEIKQMLTDVYNAVVQKKTA